MKRPAEQPDPLLSPGEVARMFRVNPKTVTRWARSGRISCIRTVGGHRRYRRSEIVAALEKAYTEARPDHINAQ
jgi:excisionase family DNA binding protein